MLSKEQKNKMLKERAVECMKDNHLINTDIYAISHLVYESKRNLWGYQREHLQYKMFDLIHSYLLNLETMFQSYFNETGKRHTDFDQVEANLRNCDYSIQSNRNLIPALEITTKENVDYWYDVPSATKSVELKEGIQ